MEIPVDIQILLKRLIEENVNLHKEEQELKCQLSILEEKLSRYEHPKNSGNSCVGAVFTGKRQVIDIPPVVPIITEHRVFSRQCSCGHCQKSDYLPEAHSSVCYGKNLLGLTAYLHSRQYVPFERMREMYRDIFGLEVSSGNLVNMVERFASKAGGI